MKRRDQRHFITDEGIFVDSHPRRTRVFVFICAVISIALIVLGAAALICEFMP